MTTNGKKIRFGVLSTARIGVKKVIPAMQNGEDTEVVAIASRSAEKAREVANSLGIPCWRGSYEALLADVASGRTCSWVRLEAAQPNSGPGGLTNRQSSRDDFQLHARVSAQ